MKKFQYKSIISIFSIIFIFKCFTVHDRKSQNFCSVQFLERFLFRKINDIKNYKKQCFDIVYENFRPK